MNRKDFLKAKSTLDKAKSHKAANTEWVTQSENTYKITVDSFVKDAIKSGEIYYAKRQIPEALIVWRKALDIQPNNKKLIENIKRAEIFERSLKQLKNQ